MLLTNFKLFENFSFCPRLGVVSNTTEALTSTKIGARIEIKKRLVFARRFFIRSGLRVIYMEQLDFTSKFRLYQVAGLD